MPLGFERINAKTSQPNERIVFIKPLEGPDKAIAQVFLERIAAQCLPIMRENHILVTALEEYEPNREFVGRNFNAGEVVQLVLKSPSTGQWLPFNYVQMVMMHELAHCKQMNHSKAFWSVRNQYADQMRSLWSRGYTGEGLWGRGSILETGEYAKNTIQSDKDLPEHLCGGTYRSGGRKRRAKKQLSYQERKQRRILKKFGANGVALGEDEKVKVELEKGKKTQSKPRVAGSKRGRELRAAAALARFDQQKKVEEEESKKPQDIDDDDTESDAGFDTASDDEIEAITDINGKRLVDNKGHNLVKVCEDENPKDEDAQNELRELFQSTIKWKPVKHEPTESTTSAALKEPTKSKAQLADRPSSKEKPKNTIKRSPSAELSTEPIMVEDTTPTNVAKGICPLCSFNSGPKATTCDVCSHVLDPRKVANSWKCKNPSCRESLYLNAGDSGICGVCGERKGM
ncbi:WLM-domain-containing protein [Hypoxylon sp. FL1150]|nr:WLM-domain-containing protein [Hypoxylon sp. FL1150]